MVVAVFVDVSRSVVPRRKRNQRRTLTRPNPYPLGLVYFGRASMGAFGAVSEQSVFWAHVW